MGKLIKSPPHKPHVFLHFTTIVLKNDLRGLQKPSLCQ